MAMGEDLKRELLDQLNAEMNGAKKESADNRFDPSTGTLYSTMYRNYAISHVDNEQFTKGKIYEGGELINGRLTVTDDTDNLAAIHVRDYDFEFHLHVEK